MEGDTLLELGVAVGAALLLSLLFYRLRLPMIVGQLVAGMIVGPSGFGLIRDLSAISLLASLGIVLLLFVVELELGPRDLRRIGSKALLLTIIEFLLALLAGFASGLALGWSFQDSFFLGAVLSVSSTAIVGKITLDRRAELGPDTASTLMAVLVIEDVIAVLLLLLVPEFASGSQVQLSTISFIAVKGGLLVLATVGFGRFAAPKVINWVSQYELEVGETTFLLALSFGFLFGVLSAYLGFSPAVGSFLLGLTLLGKHSRYIKEKISPIKDLFIVFFFVSMGTLIEARSTIGVGLPLILVMVCAILGKLAGGYLGARIAGIPGPTVIGGILLVRGEFTLILAKAGVDAGIVSTALYPIAGLAILVTAIASPLFSRPSKQWRVRSQE